MQKELKYCFSIAQNVHFAATFGRAAIIEMVVRIKSASKLNQPTKTASEKGKKDGHWRCEKKTIRGMMCTVEKILLNKIVWIY